MNKIFYSWQSDKPAYDRFVKKAINKAVGLLDGFELSRDDRIGAGDIGLRIQERIDESQFFIGDISIVGEYPYTDKNGHEHIRKTPNANVIYEMGYAMKVLGHERVILVAARETTHETSDLPFDIRNRKTIITDFSDENVEPLARELVRILSAAVGTPIAVGSPYIFCQTRSWSHAADNTMMAFDFQNDEAASYFLREIYFNGGTVVVNRNLNGGEITQVHTTGLDIPPLATPLDNISFLVSRGTATYKIKQEVVTSARADGQYNLDNILPNPSIERI